MSCTSWCAARSSVKAGPSSRTSLRPRATIRSSKSSWRHNTMATKPELLVDKDYKYGFRDENIKYTFKARKGLDHDIVEQISQMKNEPQWMRDFRHRSLDIFLSKPMPAWANL